MKNFGTEFKVGLFTLVAAVTIGYMFFVLTPESFESSDKITYYTVLENAAGIIPKTHVKTNGVTIGKVKSVELQVNRTRVEMEVNKDVRVPSGSKIEIRTRGLLGDVFIEIIRVNDSGEYIKDNGFIPLSSDQVSMQELVGIVGSIAKDLKDVSSSFALVLGGDRGERNVANIVADLQELAAETKDMVSENRANIKAMTDDLRKTSNALSSVIVGKKNSLASIIDNLKDTTDDVKLFANTMRGMVDGENEGKLENIVATFDTTMQDVEKTAHSVRLVSEKIEKGEGTLGKLLSDDSTIAELEGAIKDIRDVLRPATKLKITVDYHGEYNKSADARQYFNLRFRTRPDKFYLLGVTDHKQTITTTTSEDLDGNNDAASPQITRSTVEEKQALRFNLQFAKRWGRLQGRFGLFESSGGIAADFFALNDRFRFTVEAFEWDSSTALRRTAHLKTYANILFFEHIYAIIGLDDTTATDENGKVLASYKDNFFFGAGLDFDDDDLKSIFGAVSLAK